MLKGLFGPRTFLEEGLEEWCLETWAWLLRNCGGTRQARGRPLILADKAFFPPTETEGEARAAYLFEQVKAWLGMSEWPCDLQPVHQPQSARVGEFWHINSSAPGGTFRLDGERVTITYASNLVADPRRLIAVLAHELCHYLLATIEEPSPGGVEAYELGTDLSVAFFGFGLFGANAAFSFKQHGDTFSQGWSSRRSGYLSERTWAFALALFLALKGEEGVAQPHLKPNVALMTRKAEDYLRKRPQLLEPLLAIA